ncbi:hypothetical protein SOVF_130160, partial [Spinacia oleracea]
MDTSTDEASSRPNDEHLKEPELPPPSRTTRRNATNVSQVNNKVEEEDECTITGANVKKLTSQVWNFFDKKVINGEIKAICRGCKKALVGKSTSGTSHLKDHAKRCMKVSQTLDVKQQLLLANAQSKNGIPTMSIGKFKFNQQISRNELVNMILMHEYPLAIVDHIGFRRFVQSINPDFHIISRNTVKSDLLKDYKEEKTRLMKSLGENESKVAITTDMWTCGNQRKGYMAVTAHYIDDDWILQNRLIRFMYVPCPHNKDTISKALIACLKSFNLDEKVSTITVDNFSTNDAVMDVLREKLAP